MIPSREATGERPAAQHPAVCAPIALFVYNRPTHTRRTVEALQRNEGAQDSDLFIFSDAEKSANAAQAVREVRAYLKSVSGFKTVTVVEREKNLGLANSVVAGVTCLCGKFGRAIVMEDDLVTLPNFLRYMNDALDKYQGHSRVYGISGFSFSNDFDVPVSTYFLPITCSWGWATWADKWNIFERNRDALADRLKSPEFRKRFNYGDSCNYAGMADAQLAGRSDSWAIYWYFSVFMRSGLTLYPARSLVSNIGFDGSGTHHDENEQVYALKPFAPVLTDDVSEQTAIARKVKRVLHEMWPTPGLVQRSKSAVKRLLCAFR